MTTTDDRPTRARGRRAGTDADCTACAEGSRFLSRRGFLTLAGATGLVTATTLGGARVGLLDPLARAAGAGTDTDVLVVLSLRGGMDGLSVVVPTAAPELSALRPGIEVPRSTLKQVDQMFGLHPALSPLFPLWDAGSMAAVHAVGMDRPNRSHFEAMAEMERAAPDSSLRTGWIDRTVGVIGASSPFTAAMVGSSTLPTSMQGPAEEFAMRDLGSVKVAVDEETTPLNAWQDAVALLHAGARPEVADPTLRGLAAVATAQASPDPVEGAYPDGNLAGALRDVARLVKNPVAGLRVATVDYGGWDMHTGIGGPDDGQMAKRLGEMAAALAAFAADLGPDLDRVTLVTLSEFGRRAEQNGDGGTDHGYGNAVLLLGGGVNGGKVYGTWPGLAPDALVDGDLAATTDYRAIIAEILGARCGVSDVASVFPGAATAGLGLVRSR